jgi:aspartyl/asparaginyl beta-hydroxylase (cupin superfamily)
LRALEAADVLRIDGRPMELFFSRLRPGAHIPPHFGVANNRLTIHLPLIVPDDCSIRVGSGIHAWRTGELFAFDDSFEHEAWNRSSEDRVVLIFESHHPDLGPEERAAIEYAFEARGRWLRERNIPL